MGSRTTRQLIRHLAITITMSDVTVIRRSEQTDVTGKLVIENILEEMKEAGPGIGSLVASAVFRAGDFIFHLKMYLNNTEEDIQCISGYIINMTNNASTLTNVCFELRVIPSNSTETLLLTKLRSPKMKLKASGDTADGQGWHKAVNHAAVKEVCKERDDLLFAITAKLKGKQEKISSCIGHSTVSGMRKRKCCAGGVLENIYKKMRDTDFALRCDDESIPCHKNILAGASSVFEAMIGK